MKTTWKIWLRRNLMNNIGKDDYMAVVSVTGKTRYNKDIARAIKDEGSELQLETLLDILNRGDRIRCNFLQKGYSVHTNIVHIAPRVTGNWSRQHRRFDPELHAVTVDATPTAELREALLDVEVEVIGDKANGGAFINLVTDTTTGKIDGTITPGGDLLIKGHKIKIDPAGEPGLGVFFTAADGTVWTSSAPLAINTPKKLVCRVPDLPAGSYTLSLITRFTKSGQLLKEPRTLVYNLRLTARPDDGNVHDPPADAGQSLLRT